MQFNGQDIERVAVIGLGLTGRSCASYLIAKGLTPRLIDTRLDLDISAMRRDYCGCEIMLSELACLDLSSYQLIVVSPGISIRQQVFTDAQQAGAIIAGDIELFAQEVNVPVIAITGSNGKTTVTTLLEQMAINSGVKAQAAGNIGLPVLEALQDKTIELFILELSSFQLETTSSLKLTAATVLNISDDHMDRYEGLADYAQVKRRIYQHCQTPLINRQDLLTHVQTQRSQSFGLGTPANDDEFGLCDGQLMHGSDMLIPCHEMAMVGQHNQLNALAAIALGYQVGFPLNNMLKTLRTFSGLEHRCQLVSSDDDIVWINDSKATNVGATLAALEGLKTHQGRLILIAGGDAKGTDLSPLKQQLNDLVSHLITMGKDAPLFNTIYGDAKQVNSMSDAVALAANLASAGDIVLLSPACASIDMFANYMERGQQFINEVGRLHEH